MSSVQIRQQVQKQKEIPPLSSTVQRVIQVLNDPDLEFSELADALQACPTIAARLLGMANSAFFGQQGRVHAIQDAIFVLGLVAVKSLTYGMAVSGSFDTRRCPEFRPEQYWFSALTSAIMGHQLYLNIPVDRRPPGDSVYVAGLLHNLGLLVLVHLYPQAMTMAFSAHRQSPDSTLAKQIQEQLGTDHYHAGAWLGRKWHLPDDLLKVMRHHHDRAYRDDHWSLVLLTGCCARQAEQGFSHRGQTALAENAWESLGVSTERVTAVWEHTLEQLQTIEEMAKLLIIR